MACRFVPLGLALLAGCTLSETVQTLEQESPPQGLGRPDWVAYPASGGAWLGGAAGWLVSVVTLPVTFPVTLIAEDPLGFASDEFMFWGTSAGASGGHFILGAPLDSIDYLFRRAWVVGPEVEIEDRSGPVPGVEATIEPGTPAVTPADSTDGAS